MSTLPHRRALKAAIWIAVPLALGGCHAARGIAATLQSTAKFTQCTPDARILCEPGAEAFGRSIAPLLPAAIATVERAHCGRFAAPIRIQVYASRDSFARHAGTGSAAQASTMPGVVHLSPRLAATPERQATILAHELSHLHLFQQVGGMAAMQLPNWFMEGWPTFVSNGGGADGVPTERAVFALVHGRHFTPEDSGSLLFPKYADDYKLAPEMYYRQASLMVAYMHRRDPAAFQHMIRGVEAGTPFAASVRKAYGQPLAALWRDFQSELKTHPAAAWPGGQSA